MIGVPLTIGPVRLETNLLLAPIAGYCDLAFRLTCRELGGVGLACTDLLSPHGLLRGTAESLDLARTCAEDSPVGMQLYGSDPSIMAEGARWAADHGATIVDLNMGCPVDKVTKKDGGSKLMYDPGRAVRIADEVRRALPPTIPLTAKMRLGWDEDACAAGAAPALACALVDVGVAAITVHGRTTAMRFSGECRRDGIRRVVEAVRVKTTSWPGGPIPVIGNGDVREPGDAAAMIRETGCAGVMIGRGALSTPWIFRDAWAFQRSGGEALAPEPDDAEKIDIVRRFFERMRLYRDDHYAMHQITRRISWLGKRIAGGHCRPLKEAVRTATTPAQVHEALDAWTRGDLRSDVGDDAREGAAAESLTAA